jgi:hypothetical protein
MKLLNGQPKSMRIQKKPHSTYWKRSWMNTLQKIRMTKALTMRAFRMMTVTKV